jgi:hypothetical protein
MNLTVIKNDHQLKPKSWPKVATIKSLSFTLFLFVWAFSSAQTTISFKGVSGVRRPSADAGNFPEMTIKNQNPVIGSAIYWERYEAGVWKSYGGNGYSEIVRQAGDFRAWYRHGILGTYTATNTLTVINRKGELIPSVNADIIPEMSRLTLLPIPDNDNLSNPSSISANLFDPTLTQNTQTENIGREIVGFINEPTVYPNPWVKDLNLEFDGNTSYSLMVYNEMGVLIFTLEGLKGKTTIETDDWEKGVYMIQIREAHSTYCNSRKAIKI